MTSFLLPLDATAIALIDMPGIVWVAPFFAFFLFLNLLSR